MCWRSGAVHFGRRVNGIGGNVVPAMKVFLFTLVILTQFSLQCGRSAEKPPKLMKLKSADFAQYFPVYSVITNRVGKLAVNQKLVSSPHETKKFLLRELTDSKTPYEEKRAKVIIFEDNQPKWQLQVHGFKNLSADWVSEEVMKVEVWPGRAVQLVELIQVEAGKVLYRSATGHIFAGDAAEK